MDERFAIADGRTRSGTRVKTAKSAFAVAQAEVPLAICSSTLDMSAVVVGTAEPLIEIARATLRDLHQAEAGSLPLTLDSTLDHDLGLDSLARVELFARIEENLRVHLPESLFETAESLGDIAAALDGAPTLDTLSRRRPAERTPATNLVAAPPASIGTLGQVLRWHREHHPDFPQLTVCLDTGEETITYEQLWNDACAVAGGLQHQGIRPGDTVALMLPTSRDYFGSFFGVLLAGAVPVVRKF
jgi:acyl carrier protein